jgi:fructose-bisphosphate aldolase class II
VPIEEILEGIRYGVRKVNIDTDLRLAMTGAFRKVAVTKPDEFDPRKFLIPAMDAVTSLCKLRYEQFGSAGQASRITPIPTSEMAARYQAGSLDQTVTTS